MSDVITPLQLNTIIERFGQEAVLKCQRLTRIAFPGGLFPPSVLMALGLRETNLQNICGGAKLVDGQWAQAYTDRGVFQISDTQPTNAKWLASVPGCPNGPDDTANWDPDVKGFNKGKTSALTAMHCPTFSAAAQYTLAEMKRNRQLAYDAGVTSPDCLQFIVAAHNAGFEGALTGYREGNVDANTTLGDYSWWTLHYAPQIAAWITNHPGWAGGAVA